MHQRVFTCSMSDFFHPGADDWRAEAWDVIKSCDQLDWLILTKRPGLITDRLPADWGDGYQNVWLGVTVETSDYLSRIDLLSAIPAAIRFVSAEPLLEQIDFRPYLPKIDWIITGCEQAGKDDRRPMDLDWVRIIQEDCEAAGVPHFFKQYYAGSELRKNGILDGFHRQEWPRSAA